MTETLEKRTNPTSRLIGLGLLLVAMFACMRTLRFANEWLNLAFGGLFLCVPFLAIPPVLRLHGKARMATAAVLIPVLAIATLGLLALAVDGIPALAEHREMSRQLSTLQQGGYSVHLTWEESAGGAIGPHGLSLEQRRSLFLGLYAIRTLGYFEGASEGSISVAGPNKIELHIPRTAAHSEVNRVYVLRPCLYF